MHNIPETFIRYDNGCQKVVGDHRVVNDIFENGWDDIEYLDESPSSDPAEIELPFMDAREWSDADKAKLVEETMRLSAAPIMNTMAMLGINNLMRCEVVNHATGDEYIFSFQRKETKPYPAEVLVVALKEIASPISRLTKKEIKYLAGEELKKYEQLKQPHE